VEDARESEFTLEQQSTQHLISIIAQGQNKGLNWWDPDYILLRVQKLASKQLGIPLNHLEEKPAMPTEADQPKEIKDFAAKFKR